MLRLNIARALAISMFTVLMTAEVYATMPTLTPEPKPGTPKACNEWAANQDSDAIEMWGIQENGNTSRDVGLRQLSLYCLGQSPPEIVGFRSSVEFDEAYCKTHPKFKICERYTKNSCEIMDPTGTPLNVRASPNGHIVGTLRNGVQIIVLDRASDQKGQAWVYVGRSNDQSPIGWVYRQFIACATNDLSGPETTVSPPYAADKVHPGDSIGWVKSSDIECKDDDTCELIDNYTDAGKSGALCAVFGIPVYNRPNGTPIAELGNVINTVVRGEQHNGYTFVSALPDDHNAHPIMPYNPKDLHQCG